MTATSFKSVSDTPITNNNDDCLGNARYAQALAHFIVHADTPITIGIQGGWGSGKTSLLRMLSATVKRSIIVEINAWEFSLFQHREAVAIGLLSGMTSAFGTELKTACDKNEIDKATYEAALCLPSAMQKVVRTVTNTLGMFARMAIKSSVGHILDTEVSIDGSGASNHIDAASIGTASLKELRKALNTAVTTTIQKDTKKNFDRILFIIDDLDRVDPVIAIEILDVLKNIVEVPGCVFILAIDYEIVVKGLRTKFGERSDANEREFRQYFDKIIQVPFSMPVGAYRQKGIPDLIKNLFERIGHTVKIDQVNKLADYACRLTDGTPRSIKRIINTMSLLSLLRTAVLSDSPAFSQNESRSYEEGILFVFVCIQINFPQLFQKIFNKANFWDWNQEDCLRWGITDSRKQDDLDGHSLQDPEIEWQRVFRMVCALDSWTLNRVEDLIAVLEEVYQSVTDSLKARKARETPEELLRSILQATSITIVGSDVLPETKPSRWAPFWKNFIEAIRGKSELFQKSTGSTSQWITSNIQGVKGVSIEVSATTTEIRASLFLNLPEQEKNKKLFDQLKLRQDELERKSGRRWVWDRKDDAKYSSISARRSGVDTRNNDPNNQRALFDFLIEEVNVLHELFKEPLMEELGQNES